MEIRDDLIKAGLMKKFSSDPKSDDSCVLSTVDRFQGDESDIVLVSLVTDSKSKTPFVKLQNRMVVLLSRARIAMYIVGNLGIKLCFDFRLFRGSARRTLEKDI